MEGKTENAVQALKAHLALNVHDVQRSLEFYRKMLDVDPLKVRTGYAKFDLQNPPLNLTLNEVAFTGRGALSHLGIQVASTNEMQTNCCYATQDKTWVQDPDGNEWEVFVVLQDNLPETAPCECGVKVAETSNEVEPAATIASGCCVPAQVGIER